IILSIQYPVYIRVNILVGDLPVAVRLHAIFTGMRQVVALVIFLFISGYSFGVLISAQQLYVEAMAFCRCYSRPLPGPPLVRRRVSCVVIINLCKLIMYLPVAYEDIHPLGIELEVYIFP